MSDVLLQAIKTAAKQTSETLKPCNWLFGEVTGTSPLEITIEQRLVISADFLVLTKNTCDWSVDMSVNHKTENKSGGSGYAEFASHNHEYKGRKTYLVHNALTVGDTVILLREQGGQRFIVLDRVYNPDRGCSD